MTNQIDKQYQGNDNYGRPKADYLTKIAAMSDEDLYSECYSMIYQAARCNNNPRADWHWMCDACYDESMRRTDTKIYDRAHKQCVSDHT